MSVREIRPRIGFSRGCLESMLECDQRHGIVLECDTQTPELGSGKVCIIEYSHHLCSNAHS